ncbi:unnamed protein product [Lactuca virosa]|uniref:Uncharacterized protein n=1 Tax=Lactuca virosa TaxID=75947 RepID=A0AAU9L9V2_9ASTR|nr:unnamed protein product [Lactuca virosa]
MLMLETRGTAQVGVVAPSHLFQIQPEAVNFEEGDLGYKWEINEDCESCWLYCWTSQLNILNFYPFIQKYIQVYIICRESAIKDIIGKNFSPSCS